MFDVKKMLHLYFVAGTQDCRHLGDDLAQNLLFVLEQALSAGITCFQFRDKGRYSLEHNPAAQKALAIQCRDLCRRYNVPFIMNDDVELALEIQADGIHVGQSDMNAQEIRAKTDRTLLIGLSVNTLEQAKIAEQMAEIDYIGTGPIFPTQSKEDPKPVIGTDFPARLRQAGIQKPIVAIGGIKADSVALLRQSGANGVAVISAISQAENIPAAVKALL